MDGAAPQTFYVIRDFYVLPLKQHLMVSVATIVVAPLGTYAYDIELSNLCDEVLLEKEHSYNSWLLKETT